MSSNDLAFSELILASTSGARRALMDSLGVRYRTVAPGVGEEVPAGTSAQAAVAMLAHRKAAAVFAQNPQALVIGSDQLVSADGEVLGKPPDRDRARAQLQKLSGRSHQIVTGVCLLGPGIDERHVDVATLTLYPLTADEVEGYLDTREWEGCAGGYRVEARGQALFSRIDGDRTGVRGLPMVALVGMLRRAGVRFFESPGRA